MFFIFQNVSKRCLSFETYSNDIVLKKMSKSNNGYESPDEIRARLQAERDANQLVPYNPDYFCENCKTVGHTEIYCWHLIKECSKTINIYGDPPSLEQTDN